MPEPVDFVSIAYPTVLDGTVVRWYASLDAADHHDPVATASRHGVEFLRDEVHPRIQDAARGAHRELAANPDADVRHYCTHEKHGRLIRPRGGETS